MTDTAVQHQLGTLEISIDKIFPNPDNVRSDVGAVTDLAASIRLLGILEPLVVCRRPGTTDEYLTIGGARRLAAGVLIGLSTLPCIVRPVPEDDAEWVALMMAENGQREPLNPIDEGRALLRIRESAGYRRPEQIAARVNRSKEWVQRRLRLVTELPEDVHDLVALGKDLGGVTIGDAEAVAALKVDDTAKRRLLRQGPDQRKAAIAEAERIARADAAKTKAVKDWGDRLVTVYPDPGPWGRCTVGSKPGELNLPEGMLAGGDIVPVWNETRKGVEVYCTHPERYDIDLYVSGPGENYLPIPDGAVPIRELVTDHRARTELERCLRDDVVMLLLPWGNLVVTTDPRLYTDKRRKGYTSEDDLVAAYMAWQEGRRPGEPMRDTPRWVPAETTQALIRARILNAIDDLDEPATFLILRAFELLGEVQGHETLVDVLSRSAIDDLQEWADQPAYLEERDAFHTPWLNAVLQACVDAGDPPPNLESIRTRIDVITKGEAS